MALSDPTRRAVLERLRAGPASVQQIAAGLPVSRPAVSQHLKVLREANLVRDEPRGSARIYSIHRPGLRELRDWIEGFWDEALDNFKTYAESKE
jgi:DNA-binding transcriptional ArsR family regulator